jgi:RNA polymerase sigma factor (sigma-70 family)
MPRADALAGGATGHEATLPLERARLVRLCLQLTGDVDAAEDLAQETLYEAWRHRHRVHDPRGLHRWLAAIARHVCRRWAQRRGRDISRRLALSHGEGEDGDAPREGLTDAFDVEVELERRELVDLLDRAMALLPPPTRAADRKSVV